MCGVKFKIVDARKSRSLKMSLHQTKHKTAEGSVGICKTRKTVATHKMGLWAPDDSGILSNSIRVPPTPLFFNCRSWFVFKCVQIFLAASIQANGGHDTAWAKFYVKSRTWGFVCRSDTIGYGEFTTAINPSKWHCPCCNAMPWTEQYRRQHYRVFVCFPHLIARRLWNNKLFNVPVNLSLLPFFTRQHLSFMRLLLHLQCFESREFAL